MHTLAHWQPKDHQHRLTLLNQIAQAELKLSASCLQELQALSLSDVVTNLRLQPTAALMLCLSDAKLYHASLLWQKEEPRKFMGTLKKQRPYQLRIIGYGLYALMDQTVEKPLLWELTGYLVFQTAWGWQTFLQQLVLPYQGAQALQKINQESAPWAKRYRVLEFLALQNKQKEALALLELASTYGPFFTRLRARAALTTIEKDIARKRLEATQAAQVASYPDLIPIEHFQDVRKIGDQR